MKNIKNIIFDYGNVIFTINFKLTQQAFKELGIKNVNDFFAHKGHHSLFDDFETGKSTSAQFRDGIRQQAHNFDLTDTQIDQAWNSLLIGVAPNNHQILLNVKQRYRTFLLSNTNQIHYDCFSAYIKKEFGIDNYDNHFEKAYFSHLCGMCKPHPEIFKLVLDNHQLKPEETLFIDDSPQHLVGAQTLGINTLLMDRPAAQLQDFLIEHQIL